MSATTRKQKAYALRDENNNLLRLALAQAEFAARYPGYDCPAVYWCGARFWFVMEG